MLAGIVAALLGPEVGRRFSIIEGLPDYVGSFLVALTGHPPIGNKEINELAELQLRVPRYLLPLPRLTSRPVTSRFFGESLPKFVNKFSIAIAAT